MGKASITTKIVIISAVLAAVFLGSSFGFAVYRMRAELIAKTVDILEFGVSESVSGIRVSTEEAEKTVVSLVGTPPIQGFVRARQNDGFDELENSTEEQWRRRLNAIFAAEMEAAGIFGQLRYIDEFGNELVRVNYENGVAKAVGVGGLQNKSDRQYFVEAMNTSSDEVYVSSANLNREGEPAVISEPHTPVIRYAVPVIDSDGQRRGIVVANVLIGEIIENHLVEIEDSEVYVVDENGFYLWSADESKRWGSAVDLGHGANFGDEFAVLASRLVDDRGVVDSGNSIYAYGMFHPSSYGRGEWLVIKGQPKSAVFGPIDEIVAYAAVVAMVTFVVLFMVFLFAIRRMLFPLKKLTMAAEEIGKGNLDQNIAVESGDEIGVLAREFNKMSESLKEARGGLENKVKERTRELEENKTAVLNLLDDIGEEKEKTEKQAEELRKFRMAVEAASDQIVITDTEGVVLYANPVMERLTGFSREEVLGTKAGKLWGGLMDEEFYKNMWKTIKEDKTVYVGELKNRRKNGVEYEVLLKISPVMDESGGVKFFVAIERDITREKQIDRMKDEFLSVASHELRTPLTAIDGLVAMIREGDFGEVNEELKQPLEDINASSERLIHLVNDLLSVSRMKAGRLKYELSSFDLKSVVDETVNLLGVVAEGKNIHLYSEEFSGISVFADKDKVKQLLSNLIGNALKFTDQGRIIVRAWVDGEVARVQVEDTGVGIAKEDQDKLFGRFQQLDAGSNRPAGTGLGLYISKQICEKMGGDLKLVRSNVGEGSVFEFSLPLDGSGLAGRVAGAIEDEAKKNPDQKADKIEA